MTRYNFCIKVTNFLYFEKIVFTYYIFTAYFYTISNDMTAEQNYFFNNCTLYICIKFHILNY